VENYEAIMKLLVEALQSGQPEGILNAVKETLDDPNAIPVGVSNRHLHLSQEDQNALFGTGYEMKRMKDLSQPGQFACNETVTICGPKGAIEKVRILGPVRGKTQVEILEGDCFKLGVKAQPKLSGDLAGTPGITIIGPKGSVQLKEGLIIAQRHIHMTMEDAQRLGVHDGQIVAIDVPGEKGGTFKNVAVRATAASALECHIDTEEANAMSVNSSTKIKIIK